MFHDRPLLDAIIEGLEGEGRQAAADAVRELCAESVHPLGRRGVRLGSAAAQALGERLLGGAGPVMRSGERSALGPTRACQAIQVHITTACLVTLELWMPFATTPCGRWDVRGPGSTQITLVPDEPPAGGLVGPDDFGVVVALGRDGEFPAWITFGP